ncbi:MAG: SDR family oxidoreductase [Bryobacteraceae bacterium]
MSVLNLFRLDGKLALVTGCRRGIGFAIAGALAEAGADVAGVSRSLEDDGGSIGERVRALGRRFFPYRSDLADRAALRGLLARLAAELPPIDILINNAGAILRAPAVAHPDEAWDAILATNLTAPWMLARAIGRTMVERRSGKIVFIASLLSFQGGILVPSYAASKGGVAQLVKALANEWAPFGVCVNAIAPGYIATDNTAALRDDPVRGPAILSRIPAGRWGEPGDLAGAAVFLASRASDYVHGSILVVDGGWLSR